MSKKDEVKLDKYYYHEAIDRCHLINCILNDYLLVHPVVSQNGDWVKRLEDASFQMGRVYQEISEFIDKQEEEEEEKNNKN